MGVYEEQIVPIKISRLAEYVSQRKHISLEEANTFRVVLNNVPSDIKAMLDSVSRTQVRANVIPSQSQEVSFKDVNEFMNYFSTVVL